MKSYPMLRGNKLFRRGELVYINRSDELQEYCNIIHRHDFIEIAYVIEGKGVHVVGDNTYNISKGDLFIINYDVPHGFLSCNESSTPPIVYNCIFMPEFLDMALFSSNHFQDITSSFLFKSLFPEDYQLGPDLRLHGAEFTETGDLFSRMYSEYKLMQKGYTDIIRAYLIQLIVKIFRYTCISNKRKIASKNIELILKAMDYLKQNFNAEVKLEDLAMKSFISKNYFSRLFREITGVSFSDYIQQLRIDEACSLLKTTNLKIITIASQAGFKDLKFFYEVFKKYTGKTPGDYRKGS